MDLLTELFPVRISLILLKRKMPAIPVFYTQKIPFESILMGKKPFPSYRVLIYMSENSSSQKMSPKDLMIVIVIGLGSFMAGLDATIVNIALPTIAKFFEVPTVTASWVLNAYLIIMVSLLLAASRIGDISSRTGPGQAFRASGFRELPTGESADGCARFFSGALQFLSLQ
jgi:hypothetical protein